MAVPANRPAEAAGAAKESLPPVTFGVAGAYYPNRSRDLNPIINYVRYKLPETGTAMPAQSFPIVGIGASAGGLEAVTALLANLPAATGMAFVFLQHLSPDHDSLLPEILGKRTPLTVVEAQEGLAVEPNRLYIIPAGAKPSLAGGVFHLELRAAGDRRPPKAIDQLLQSLAAEGGNCMAVILSGTGSDGLLGIRAIKAAGGIVFAQDPASAQFGEMPNNVIASGCVDFVLPLEEIARRLADLAQHRYFKSEAVAPAVGEPPAAATLPAPDDEGKQWPQIFRLLRAASGIDFTNYKGATIRRRLERRMALQRITHFAEYVQFLHDHPAEAQALAADFLIRVTRFFREPETLRTLAQLAFPRLLENRPADEALRIWVPGCASGEEVYSLAIGLCELLDECATAPPLQFFGTDVSDGAIEQARAGDYPDSIAADVSPERLQRFFVAQGNRYRIAKSIRDLCVFARQNVLADPPFSRIDLVSCRNLLIYFDPILQQQALALFHYALKPGGFLVLGPAETVGPAVEGFEVVDKRQRIYRREPGGGFPPALRRSNMSLAPRPAPNPPTLSPPLAERVQKEGDRILLARYVPASILVDERLNILQFRGHTAPYLEHLSGAASLNLHKLAPSELLVSLTAALEAARQDGMPVQRQAQLEREDGVRPVSFEVVPFHAGEAEPRHYLIVFQEVPEAAAPAGSPAGFWTAWWGRARGVKQEAVAADGQEEIIRKLRRELEVSRYALRTVQDDYEAFKEELGAAHEKWLAANEELQSTNEELESAKEELQATNEELSTTNDELRHRNRELNEANETVRQARDYADAIIDTVREGLLVLDGELRVLRANRTFYELFKTRGEDTQDRFLFNLGEGQWNIPQLQALLQEIRGGTTSLRDYAVTHVFPGLGERTMLLNARLLAGAGAERPKILLAIEDITERTRAATQLREDDRHKDEFLAMLAHELRNPLAPIQNAVQLMRTIGLQEPQLEWARGVIDRQVRQLACLVDDLLDAARIRQNKIVLKRVLVDLAAIVQNVVEISQPLLNANHQELIVAVPPSLPRVQGDPIRLVQAIANLLNNAVKYTPAGGQIRLSVEPTGAEIVVRVQDNGVGIDPALLPQLFELFTQGHRTMERAEGGLGIGLSLVRHIAELHGGTVEAFSAGLGQGSEFVMRLPVAQDAEAIPAIAQEQAPASPVAHRVLVVDDNVDAAKSLGFFLDLAGYETRLAYDAPAALEIAPTFKPDVVVLDIGLPGMNGYDLATHLRSLPETRHAHLIAVTGYSQAQDKQWSEAAGIDIHLVKPVDAEALNRLIGALELADPVQ